MTYSTNKSKSKSTNKSKSKSTNKSNSKYNKFKNKSTNKSTNKFKSKSDKSKSKSNIKSTNNSKTNTSKSKVNNNRVNTTDDNINYEGGGIFDFISDFFGYKEEKPLSSYDEYQKNKYEQLKKYDKIIWDIKMKIEENGKRNKELINTRNDYDFESNEYKELTKNILDNVNTEYELLIKFQDISEEAKTLREGVGDYSPSLPSNIGQISLNGYIDDAKSPRDFSYKSRSLRRYLRNDTPMNQIETPSNGPKNKALTNKRYRNNNTTNNNRYRAKQKK